MEILPREWAVPATYWAPQSWGPTLGRLVPLAAWRVSGTNRRAVGIPDSTHEEHTGVALLPKQRKEDRLKLLRRLAGFP